MSKSRPVINPAQYGVSFSIAPCGHYGIEPRKTLQWLLEQGFRRFRLMSYWDLHEKEQGEYDFSQLDWQIELVEKAGGAVSLCLGVKQPRWPEYHWPAWALRLPAEERKTALLQYVTQVVQRYKGHRCIVQYQLENEALLQGFGENIIIDRRRLRGEFDMVKEMDRSRPVAMSTSNGWGIPVRRPRPDAVGFSFYPIIYKGGKYHTTIQKPWLHRLRKTLIRLLLHRPVFIHELQCEPWGPTAIWKMSLAEQDKSMSPEHIRRNIATARSIQAYPIDLWGGEWWYWRTQNGDDSIIKAVQQALAEHQVSAIRRNVV